VVERAVAIQKDDVDVIDHGADNDPPLPPVAVAYTSSTVTAVMHR
jgi:hypothetical protein